MKQYINRFRWLRLVLTFSLFATGLIASGQTVNLTSHEVTTTTTYNWYSVSGTAPNYTYTLLTAAQKTAAGPGLYAADTLISSPANCKQYAYLKVVTNVCPATTVDLSSSVAAAPAGASLVYFNSATSTTELTSSVVSTSGTYYVAYKYNSPADCYSSRTPIVVAMKLCTDPDANVTYVGIPATGNLSTNDGITGATYNSAPPTVPAGITNPSNAVPSVNADGTYTFTATTPGVYTFSVPVCKGTAPNTTCTNETLTITVKPVTVTSTAPGNPVANPDYATVAYNSGTGTEPSVTIPVKLNDAATNPGTTLGTPTLGTVPSGTGTATVDGNGNIVFVPAVGFTGEVKIPYTVCETPDGTKCATSFAVIDVKAQSSPTNTLLAPNSTVAVDDYATTNSGTALTVNPLANDKDPEGDAQSVVIPPASETGSGSGPSNPKVIDGKGSYYFDTNGQIVFTPLPGYFGPVAIPYTITDNNASPATSSATVNILVKPPVINTDPDFNSTIVGVPVKGNLATNDDAPGGSYGIPTAQPGNPSSALPTVNPDGTYTFTATVPGTYVFTVPVCIGTAPNQICTNETLTITVQPSVTTSTTPLMTVNPDVATVGYYNGTGTAPSVVVNVLANDKTGTSGTTLSNPTLGTVPAGTGSATVNSDGTIKFTPAAGFYGEVVIPYTTCETPDGSSICKTTTLTITVPEPGAGNFVQAADDYATTTPGGTVTVPVKNNDTQSAGGTLTVVAPTTGAGSSSTNPIVVPGKGSYYYDATGQIVFTALPTYYGPVDIPYTVKDADGKTASATLHVLVKEPPFNPSPDVNVGYVSVPVKGDVSTNDKLPTPPTGTTYTYGTPVASSSNPVGGTITMGTDGKYTFTGTTPGVYTYTVPVCITPNGTTCVDETLTITILPTTLTYPPIANTDFGTVPANTGSGTPPSVTLNTLSNDAANGNTTLNVGSVAIKDPATGNFVQPTATTPLVIDGVGKVSVDPATGNTTFTPAPGYVGTYTYTYKVCDNSTPTAQCTEAVQQITVEPTNVDVLTAADDYGNTTQNTPLSVGATKGVLSNDVNADATTGETLQVTTTSTTAAPFNLTDPAGNPAGTLVMNSDGSYVFTPANDWTGTTNFVYTVCETGGTGGSVCKNATLYLTTNKPTGALPAELLSFTVRDQNCNAVLGWTVGAEVNVAKYEIESSTTGNNFIKVGTVPAVGSNRTYNYTDLNTAKGVSYYRLRIVDNNGSIKYSNILRFVSTCSQSQVQVMPTVTTDVVYVKGMTGNNNLYVTNAIGQVVLKLNSKHSFEKIHLGNFASGVYNLIIRNENGEVITTKIVKQ